jgi:WD40 repeat protein
MLEIVRVWWAWLCFKVKTRRPASMFLELPTRAPKRVKSSSHVADRLPVKELCELVDKYAARFSGNLRETFTFKNIHTAVGLNSTQFAVAFGHSIFISDLLTIEHSFGLVMRMVAVDSKWLACAFQDRVVLWDFRTGLMHSTIPVAGARVMAPTAFGMAIIQRYYFPDRVEMWSFDGHLKYTVLRGAQFCFSTSKLVSLVDGSQFAVHHDEHIVSVFDAQTGACANSVVGAYGLVELCAMSEGRVAIVTLSKVCIWNPRDWFPTKSIPSHHVWFAAEVDKGILVLATVGGHANIWDVGSDKCLGTFRIPENRYGYYGPLCGATVGSVLIFCQGFDTVYLFE